MDGKGSASEKMGHDTRSKNKNPPTPADGKGERIREDSTSSKFREACQQGEEQKQAGSTETEAKARSKKTS